MYPTRLLHLRIRPVLRLPSDHDVPTSHSEMVCLRWQSVGAMPLNIMQTLEVKVSSSVMGNRLLLVTEQVAGGGNKAPWVFLSQNRAIPTVGRRAEQQADEADVFTIWASTTSNFVLCCVSDSQKVAHSTTQRIVSRHHQCNRLQYYTRFLVH